jgi:hypothetical protein
MAVATLAISSKNYSSWSLRGWRLTRMSGNVLVEPGTGSAFDENFVRLEKV